MTESAGSKCATRLGSCRPYTLLPTNQAAESLLVTTVGSNDPTAIFDRKEHASYDQLHAAIPARGSRQHKSTIISLSAFNSFSPLRVTIDDLVRLVNDENIDPTFAAVVSSFGCLPRVSELGYSCMATRKDSDGSYIISYLLRFAEKEGNHWKIRQLGVYQAYDATEDSHLWILLHAHPLARDALSKKLSDYFATLDGCNSFRACPDLLHALILDEHIPTWRWYLESIGETYSDLSYKISTVEFRPDHECDATLPALQKCKFLLEKIAALPAIMDALVRIVSSITGVQGDKTVVKLRAAVAVHRQALIDMKSSSDVLLRQTQGLVELLGNTLDLKNQQDAALLNQHLLKLSIRTAKDSVVIRVITFVTLLYLPATFVATLFGMDFFEFEGSSKKLLLSSDIWIYFVVLAGLTGITLAGWWFWTKAAGRDGSLRLANLDDEKV